MPVFWKIGASIWYAGKTERVVSSRKKTLISYTVKEGNLIKTVVPQNSGKRISLFPGGSFLKLGNHPMAQSIKEFGISPKPFMSVYYPERSVILANIFPPISTGHAHSTASFSWGFKPNWRLKLTSVDSGPFTWDPILNTSWGDPESRNCWKVSGDEGWDEGWDGGCGKNQLNCPDINLDYQKLLSWYLETQPKLKSSASTYKAAIRTFDGPVIRWSDQYATVNIAVYIKLM